MGQKNAEMTFCVDVVGVFGKETVDLCDTEEQFQTVTVGQLKEKILNKLPFKGRDYIRVEVYFHGKQLEDSSLLSDHGVKHMSLRRH
uniref:Ubiquitin-like domain-containing protein n=1 Tax=Kryptolebias marmoratus TaxID=37003 RepID=A0A3Q3FTB4_KRYMA